MLNVMDLVHILLLSMLLFLFINKQFYVYLTKKININPIFIFPSLIMCIIVELISATIISIMCIIIRVNKC